MTLLNWYNFSCGCSRSGAAIHVAWRPAAASDSGRYAACASYEVQAACATGGPPLRQTCAARVHECVLAAAEPGTAYQVRQFLDAVCRLMRHDAECSAQHARRALSINQAVLVGTQLCRPAVWS